MTTIDTAHSILAPKPQSSASSSVAETLEKEKQPLYRIVEDKVILSDEAKKMLKDIGDIGDYRPRGGINRINMTSAGGRELTGKDLAYGLAHWEDALGMRQHIQKTAKEEEQMLAQHLEMHPPKPKAAVELDPKWAEAAKHIPNSTAGNSNAFVWKNAEFADTIEYRLNLIETPSNRNAVAIDEDFISRRLNQFKTEMTSYGLTQEAEAFFTDYMQQKHGRTTSLDALYTRYNVS